MSNGNVPGGNLGLLDGAMSAVNTAGEIIAGSMKAQAAALTVGTMVGVARANLNEKGMWPAALDTPLGSTFAELAIPAIALMMSRAYKDSMPGAQYAELAAQHALKGISGNKLAELSDAIKPFMVELIGMGMGIAQAQLNAANGQANQAAE